MGGVSRQTLNCSHLFSNAVPLIHVSLKTYFQVLSQAALSNFIKGKASTHVFLAVFFKIIETKQACQKLCYSEDS